MDERVARCMLIARVLSADGIMTADEREFLETAMEALGLDPHQQERVRNLEGWDEAEPVVAALSTVEKRALMDGLILAVLADGKVSPHETDTIARLSTALGLS